MNSLVVYGSLYGNTEKVAKTIGDSIKSKVLRAGKVRQSELNNYNLLIVGSPTQGGRPNPETQKFLNNIPANSLKNIRVAAFDTRIEIKDQKGFLRLVMKMVNYAAPKIAKSLEDKGGLLMADPEGFIVEGTEGPLRKGELERASSWAKKFLSFK